MGQGCQGHGSTRSASRPHARLFCIAPPMASEQAKARAHRDSAQGCCRSARSGGGAENRPCCPRAAGRDRR
ncbi:hypothetical protein Salmuc_04044 [Salipiger mucosus DSM 16094]|uniref:Uncharacterized protein n=1 Tax=Salipiger mucosus DSM 16094 TaxID=1123237 RepID=S9S7V0_9RHOB|nr:hypothetical protein Salmuc_04044 [Salipiger mucosus DSM 16094]